MSFVGSSTVRIHQTYTKRHLAAHITDERLVILVILKVFLANQNAADSFPGPILQVSGGKMLRESNVSLVEPNKLQNLLNEER